MARTFIRPETQIRSSKVYDDTIAPALAAFETAPTNLEADLNNLRSITSELRDGRVGNWYDALTAPSALEAGAIRGVQNVNDALHLLEKKRVLRSVRLLSDIVVTAAVAATGTLTATGNFANNDTVTIGSKTYTFQTVLTNADGNVLIGALATNSLDNLIAAIGLGAGSGTAYAAATTASTDVSALAGVGDTMDVTALAQGTAGNGISTTETSAAASWGSAKLTGGAGGDVEVLIAGELPTQLTAAVGAVTTLGTVVVQAGLIGQAGLEELAGPHALAPKNLAEIVDGATGDPILTTGVGQSPAGKRVWGLLQSQVPTDGHTINTTTQQVQIAFVIADATNSDLVLVDGEEMGGKTINYAYRERIRLEDISEGDFLNTASIDIGAGAVTPTRQLSYDNQGVTPVDLTTNATLDLEGPGLTWTMRDDLQAILLQVVEGSAGGTSKILFGADVDDLDVDAINNDFLNGLKVDTGAAGTTINIGVTANQIDAGGALTLKSGAAADLNLDGTLELNFTDSYRPGSTWSLPAGVTLADSAAEWSAFEVQFGEVSLLAAITAASNVGGFAKTCADVTLDTNADVDVGGVAGGANLNAQIHSLAGGTFVNDHDVFVNGTLLRNGANAAANNDVYPGTSLANGQLKFEFDIDQDDVICVISRA